ncbi:MAG: LysM peptidoglycan-binding domain-containing protein [Phycisphaerales bacterium]
MSLPSQVGRTPGRGPKVESRGEPMLSKPQLAAGAVGAVVILAVVVFAVVAMRGGPTDEPTTAEPLAKTETRPTTPPAAAPGDDPVLDAVMAGGSSREPAETTTPTTIADPLASAADTDDAADDDSALDAVLNQPTRSPTSGILSGVFEGDDQQQDRTADDRSNAIASADGEIPALPQRSATDEVIDQARQLRDAGRLLAARDELNLALSDTSIGARDRARLRETIGELNDTLVFSPHLEPGDSMAREYRVKSGDSLARIARAQDLGTHWKLIARVNGITNPSRINVGQRLKLVSGPFHVIVDKSDFRADIYHGPADNPREWVYVTSRPVGLGEGDGTPAGTFVVAPGKLENPGWVNPRDSSERYDRNDPANPIGEHWVGLTGVGDSAVHTGLGLHGTIEPDSIGREMSMGCVRLRDDDAALMYELLTEGESVVRIVP